MYRVCIPLFSRCVFLTRIPWQLFSDEQSRRSPGRVWSGIWNPISSHWHLDPYNCRLYYIYIGYIYCYIIVVASQGSDGSILEKPEQDDCGKLCRTSVSAEPVRIKLEKRIYNILQHITNSNRDWRLCKCLQETNGQTVGSALARPGSLEKGLVPP